MNCLFVVYGVLVVAFILLVITLNDPCLKCEDDRCTTCVRYKAKKNKVSYYKPIDKDKEEK